MAKRIKTACYKETMKTMRKDKTMNKNHLENMKKQKEDACKKELTLQC